MRWLIQFQAVLVLPLWRKGTDWVFLLYLRTWLYSRVVQVLVIRNMPWKMVLRMIHIRKTGLQFFGFKFRTRKYLSNSSWHGSTTAELFLLSHTTWWRHGNYQGWEPKLVMDHRLAERQLDVLKVCKSRRWQRLSRRELSCWKRAQLKCCGYVDHQGQKRASRLMKKKPVMSGKCRKMFDPPFGDKPCWLQCW